MRSARSNTFSIAMSTTDEIRRWSEELARDPASLVFLQLGEALRRQGQSEIALKVALRGLERYPRTAEAHDLVARIAVDRRDFVRAADEWEAVLRLVPDHVGAMKGLGYICFQQGRFDDAEWYLAHAGGGDAVSAALETVRRSSGGIPQLEVAPMDAADVSPNKPELPVDPQRLFEDILVDDGQTALLLDASGYVLGGLYVDGDGNDLAHEIGAQLSGISEEVVRATRHLDIGEWKSIVFETHVAVVGMAPTPDQGLVVVAASRATPLGLLRLLIDRCCARTAGWIGRSQTS